MTGFKKFGKPYNQVFGETMDECLNRAAERRETTRDRQNKQQAFLVDSQCGVYFCTSTVSQVVACDSKIYQINNEGPCHEPEGNFLPLF